MSFSRLQYDQCNYQRTVKESTDVGKYMYNEPRNDNGRNDCRPCFPTDPYIRSGFFGGAICTDKPLVDVDSELIGLNYRNSRCPENKYIPSDKEFCLLSKIKDCDDNHFLSTEPSRISNPPSTLRCSGVNRWDWLPCDPQNNVSNILPFERLANSQIMAKDAHRACIPNLLDDSALMPQYTNQRTEVYNLQLNPMPVIIEHNNVRNCSEIKRL